jgi:hypothetical protein
MHVHHTLAGLALGVSMAAAAVAQPQQLTQLAGQAQQPGQADQQRGQARQQQPTTDEEAIANAMSAAPAPVAAQATIVVLDPGGGMRTLRQGTNGVTCMPDDPATPALDPMCLDRNAMRWLQALQNHAAPPDSVGFAFVLVGGTEASNTDPHAQGPAPGAQWIVTGPHIMIVGPAVGTMED